MKKIILLIFISFCIYNLSSTSTFADSYFFDYDKFHEFSLKTSEKNYFVFNNSKIIETIRKWRKSKIKIDQDDYIESRFRNRGWMIVHTDFSNKSIKIKITFK